MSSIIQAFFIDPVIRQARKISGLDDGSGSSNNGNRNRSNVKPAPPHDPHSLSHASPGEDEPRHRNHHHHLCHVQTDQNASPPPVNRLGHALFDRFAPLVPASFAARPAALDNDAAIAAPVGTDRRRTTTTTSTLPASTTLPHANIYYTTSDGLVDPADVPLPASPTCSSPSTFSFDIDDLLMADGNVPPNAAFRTPERRRSRERSSPQTPSPRLSRANSSTGRLSRAHSRRNVFALTERTDASKNNHLPADDGMQSLRQRIHEICELAISSEEKAKRMHDLMTQDWNALRAQQQQRPQSPASICSGHSCAASPPHLSGTPQCPASPASMLDTPNPYNLQPDDLKPTYRPNESLDSPIESPPPSPDSGDSQPTHSLGCVHYKRNVKIQCYDCKKWYSCRHCHDEAEPSHALNRRKTENMLCMLCLTPQAAGQHCSSCGEKAAYYYCEICKLWDDDATKRIYHCVDCGICRRGEGIGKDFVHCKKCNVCISIAFASSHRCIERATDCDCPICSDYMFTSPQDIVAMPCGHYMHHTCYTEYMQREYRCPICKKSAVNMELQWRKLESAIEGQPMPAQWRDVKAEVRCNDCGARGVGRYHWLGNKCGTCDGFNTNEIRLIGANEGARREAEQYAEGERRVAARSRAASTERIPLASATGSPTLSRNNTTTNFASLTQARPQGQDQSHPIRTRAQLLQPRDYFASNFDQPRRPSSAAVGATEQDNTLGLSLPNPYEMLARMSRSLSPIRHYFDEHMTLGGGENGADGTGAAGAEIGVVPHGRALDSDTLLPPLPAPQPYSLAALMRPRSADSALLAPTSSLPSSVEQQPQHHRSRSWALSETLGLWGEGWLFNSSEDDSDDDDEEGDWEDEDGSSDDDSDGPGDGEAEFEEDWESSDDDMLVGVRVGGAAGVRGRSRLGGGLRLIGHR